MEYRSGVEDDTRGRVGHWTKVRIMSSYCTREEDLGAVHPLVASRGLGSGFQSCGAKARSSRDSPVHHGWGLGAPGSGLPEGRMGLSKAESLVLMETSYTTPPQELTWQLAGCSPGRVYT